MADKRVVYVPNVTWVSKKGRFTGDAFFPAGWQRGDPQPHYIAAQAPGWDHGCVEAGWNRHNEGGWVGSFEQP
jgi:hypothetical protein